MKHFLRTIEISAVPIDPEFRDFNLYVARIARKYYSELISPKLILNVEEIKINFFGDNERETGFYGGTKDFAVAGCLVYFDFSYFENLINSYDKDKYILERMQYAISCLCKHSGWDSIPFKEAYDAVEKRLEDIDI